METTPNSILQDLLGKLGFDAKLTEDQLEEGLMISIDCEGDDVGRLIGRRGQTLSDLQYLLNRILQRCNPDSERVTVDVGGYRREIRDALVKNAKEAAEKVRRWGDIVELPPMNAYDRRIVHNLLKEDKDIETHSVEVDGTKRKAIMLRPAN
ncbi:KH domain-containing protein [Verrucomicrobia bacterium]|nr:KH domain-containing protein [Verrucomicrobiota bacterium]